MNSPLSKRYVPVMPLPLKRLEISPEMVAETRESLNRQTLLRYDLTSLGLSDRQIEFMIREHADIRRGVFNACEPYAILAGIDLIGMAKLAATFLYGEDHMTCLRYRVINATSEPFDQLDVEMIGTTSDVDGYWIAGAVDVFTAKRDDWPTVRVSVRKDVLEFLKDDTAAIADTAKQIDAGIQNLKTRLSLAAT